MPPSAASFLFMDESGILQTDPVQMVFGFGGIVLSEPEHLCDNLRSLQWQAARALGITPSCFEFKFSRLTRRTLPFYQQAISHTLRCPGVRVELVCVDKSDPLAEFGPDAFGFWETYCACARQLARCCISEEGLIVVSDYLTRPRGVEASFEASLRTIPGVLNVILLDSVSSLPIQAIDLILGCALYDIRARLVGRSFDPLKRQLSDFLKEALGVVEMGVGLELSHPCSLRMVEFERIMR